MPKVRMPDGILVDMPDNPSPELKARLQAVLQKQQGAVPEPAQVPGRTFIDPGTVETPQQPNTSYRRAISKYAVHPILESVGAIGGGIVGSAASPLAGSIAGGAAD